MPLLCALCALPVPLDNDVSLPPRKHTGGQVQSPPGGTGVGRGGGMVSRASGTPIYILIYILSFISQIPITYTDRVINMNRHGGFE